MQRHRSGRRRSTRRVRVNLKSRPSELRVFFIAQGGIETELPRILSIVPYIFGCPMKKVLRRERVSPKCTPHITFPQHPLFIDKWSNIIRIREFVHCDHENVLGFSFPRGFTLVIFIAILPIGIYNAISLIFCL